MSTPRVIWLRTNRRALWLGLVVLAPSLAIALSCTLLSSDWLRWISLAGSAAVAYLSVLYVYVVFPARLGYANEHLHVRLRLGPPIQVPIHVVECFFLGQGPTLLPRPFGDRDKIEETATIVIRLAESADKWKHVDVQPVLGLWCDGYITIRGTWCEPITNALLEELNEKLIAAHREQRPRTDRKGTIETTPRHPIREQEVG